MKTRKQSNTVISENKEARLNYDVHTSYEAGISLTGSEVKSLRLGHGQLKDAHVVFIRREAYVQNMAISTYKPAGPLNHEPERRRKLLLHAHELNKIQGLMTQNSMTCIPLKLYFKKGRVKVLIAVAKGRKKHDKRQLIKKREISRKMHAAKRKERTSSKKAKNA